MADPPRRPDRSDPTRYQSLRELENQKSQPPPEPKQAETVRSAVEGWSQHPDLVSQQHSARKAINRANQMQQQRQGQQPEAKQPEKGQSEQTSDKQKADRETREIAEKLAPKEKPPDRQQERQREPEQER